MTFSMISESAIPLHALDKIGGSVPVRRAGGADAVFLDRGMASLDGAAIHANDCIDHVLLAVTSHRRTAIKHKASRWTQDLLQALSQRTGSLLANPDPVDALHDFGDTSHIRGQHRQVA